MNSSTLAKRGSLLIDKKSQGQIIVRCSLHWLIFTSAAGVVGFIIQFCMNPYGGLGQNFSDSLVSFGPTLLTLACLTPVFIYDYVKLSHQIIGPALRIRRTLQSLARDESVSRMKLRENDLHTDLVEDLNAVIDMIDQAKQKSSLANSDKDLADISTSDQASNS